MSNRKYTVESVGPRIEKFLKTILPLARLRASFEIVEADSPHPEIENPEVLVRFSGPDAETLVANRGELLLALEHLTMEMLQIPPEDHSLLCFDANDYRLLRIEELRLSALAAAEHVKASGKPFRFNPMSSRERRIVHLALRDATDVRSESTGGEPRRQVVVYPAGMPSLPESALFSPPPPRRGRRR